MLNNSTFTESYERIFGRQIHIGETGNRFFDFFYENFMASSPEVAAAFRNTDMSKQKNMLKKSLLYSINFITNKNNFESMERIAHTHSKKNYDIKPYLYDLWMDSMIAAVKQFDAQFSDEVELAWRLAFAPGITYMKFMYDKP